MRTLVILIVFCGLCGTTVRWQQRVADADLTYSQAVAKADNIAFYAKQKANTDRLKVLRQILSDSTKSGDFDTASLIKSKITEAEAAGVARQKPKNTVKFNGHEYALIDEKVTWHTAKKRCEEMGGHLACLNTPSESAFLLAICRKQPTSFWIGATDEVQENLWFWVDGTHVSSLDFIIDNPSIAPANHIAYWADSLNWNDHTASDRVAYICEWVL